MSYPHFFLAYESTEIEKFYHKALSKLFWETIRPFPSKVLSKIVDFKIFGYTIEIECSSTCCHCCFKNIKLFTDNFGEFCPGDGSWPGWEHLV